MKLTNQQILNFINSGIASKKLPVKFAYAISVNISNVSSALTAYNKQREKLLEDYAKKGEDDKPVIENNCYVFEDEAGWSGAMAELLETEAEVSVTKVSEDVLEKCDNPEFDSLTVSELSAIGFMIEQA